MKKRKIEKKKKDENEKEKGTEKKKKQKKKMQNGPTKSSSANIKPWGGGKGASRGFSLRHEPLLL